MFCDEKAVLLMRVLESTAEATAVGSQLLEFRAKFDRIETG